MMFSLVIWREISPCWCVRELMTPTLMSWLNVDGHVLVTQVNLNHLQSFIGMRTVQ